MQHSKWLLGLLFGLILVLAACTSKAPEHQYGVNFSKESITLYKGQTQQLQYNTTDNGSYQPLEVTIVITSGEDIVSITDSNITGLKAGQATIEIRLNKDAKIKDTLTVEVKNSIQIETPARTTMPVGETIQLSATDFLDTEGKGVTWTSSDTTVASIGENGIVMGLKAGTVTITAASKTNAKVATIEITVTYDGVTDVEFSFAESSFYLGETYTAITKVLPESKNQAVTITSSDPSIVQVVGTTIKPLKVGVVTLTAKSVEDPRITTTLTITTVSPVEDVVINDYTGLIEVTDSITLTGSVLPATVSQAIRWVSSDEAIATIDENGVVETFKNGEVTFTAYSLLDSNKQSTITLSIELNPMKIMTSLHVDDPLRQEVTTFGYNPDTRVQWVNGSVNQYFGADMNLEVRLVPINTNQYTGQVATPAMLTAAEPLNKVRSGILHDETKYIVYHDTGNHTPGADAEMHANYMVGSDNANNRARSWHYTVDDQKIIQHIPDNEVSWQGDAYDAYAKGIGIETAVNYGSDLYTTWQRTAKLMASLLLKYGLTVDNNVKQHYDFNGKNCPQALRMSGLYGEALDLIRAEYLVASLLSDYTITFTSLNEDIVDNRGRVINAPATATRVSYIITITGDDYEESTILYSTIKGVDGSTTVTLPGTEADQQTAKQFDLTVASITRNVTLENKDEIESARALYNTLTPVQKQAVTTLPLLEELEYRLNMFYAVSTSVVINEIMVSDNSKTKQGYVELYNPTSQDISLKGWTLQYTSSSTFTLDEAKQDQNWFAFADDAVIRSKQSYLIQLAGGNNVGNLYLPHADAVSGIYVEKAGGAFALTNEKTVVTATSNSHVIDFVGYNASTLFEGAASVSIDETIQRVNFLDTNDNARDFREGLPTPTNTYKQTLVTNPSAEYEHAMEVDLLILLLPKVLVESDASKVEEARTAYNNLTAAEKALVFRLALLEAKEMELLILENPDLAVIYPAISSIPSKITFDYPFPQVSGLTWSFVEPEASTYFDLATGTYLKISYQPIYFTVRATYNQTTKEKKINFGVLEPGQKTIFSTGKVAPAVGYTSAGFGTEANQKATDGFGGMYISVGNNVYFIGKNAYIPLSAPKNGVTFTIEELRPLGTPRTLNNQGLVGGVPTDYNGIGTLYYNATNQPLTFDPSLTYGRNNASFAGYGKIVFSPNIDGTYTVQPKWLDSGTDSTTQGRMETLLPGEYLYCPHTHETNLAGGTWLMQEGTGGAVGVLAPGTIITIGKHKVFN